MQREFRQVLAVLVLICAGFAAAQGRPQAASNASQEFTVVRTGHFIAGAENLTGADANCAISGRGYGATMQCSAAGPAKGSYHYNTALVVDAKGTGYVVACRVPLILVLCKKLETGATVDGRIDNGTLAMSDGDKVRSYRILTSANVGQLPAIESPAPSKSAKQSRSEPASDVAGKSSSNGAQGATSPGTRSRADDPSVQPPGKSPAACTSAIAACATFTSDPQGADIYVDGKFVGNTPSMILLPAGSHELRIEADKFSPWTRTFEAGAGNSVTIRATLQAK